MNYGKRLWSTLRRTKHFGTRQRETQTIYTQGNGEQVETIRAGKTIRPVTHEEGQVT